MGKKKNFLVCGLDLSGQIGPAFLESLGHQVLGYIDLTDGNNPPYHNKLPPYKQGQSLPKQVLKKTTEIIICVLTSPVARDFQIGYQKKYPGKKITTVLEQEYLHAFLAFQEKILRKTSFTGPTEIMTLRWGKNNIQFSVENSYERKRVKNVLEKKVLHYLEEIITKPMVLFDLGANIGLYTLILAKKFPACHLHAFEPEPYNFRKLNYNLGLNKLKNATTHLIAAGEKKHLGSLYLQGRTPGLGEHSLIAPVSKLHTPVRVWDLDSYIKTKKAPPADLIKIDVEGYELQVLKGLSNLLETKKPKLIMEIHQALVNEEKLLAFLEERGYSSETIFVQKKRRFIYAHRNKTKC